MRILSNNTFINVFCTMVKYLFALLSNSMCLFSNAMYDAGTILKESAIYRKVSEKKKKNIQSIWNVIIGIIISVMGALVILNVFSVTEYKVKWYVVLVSVISFLLSNLSNSLKYVIGFNDEKKEIINVNRNFKYSLYFPLVVIVCYIVTLFSKYVKVLKYADLCGAIIIAVATILMGIMYIYNNLHHKEIVADKVSDIFENEHSIKRVKNEIASYGYSKKLTYDIEFAKDTQPINLYSNLISYCYEVFKRYSDIEVISIIKSTYVERKMVNKNARNSRSRNSKKNTTKKNTKQKNKKR
ncbi:MAG: hypothetical protein ACI31M_04665 [Bacilli bacterium]